MKKILLFAFALVSFTISAQVTNQVSPRSWSLLEKSLPQPEPVIMPVVDVKKYLAEDQRLEQEQQNKSLRIGADLDVNLNLFNDGKWTELPNGDRIWRLNVKSDGAYFMRPIFDLYSMPAGGELYIYNNDKTDKIGPYTDSENQENGILGTWIVSGDNIWVEYYEPAAARGLGRLSIKKITHGYVDVYASSKVGNLNDSEACNVDVLCNPNANPVGIKDWTSTRDNYINSVARLLINTSNGTGFCSGSMVNNTAEDGTPYFLTANHCLGTGANKQPDGAGTSFDNNNSVAFGFQWFTNTPDCATFAATNGPSQPTRVLSGAQLKANNDDSDFALFLLNQEPPAAWDIYYGGWNNSAILTPSRQLGLHHPSGDIMKLARNDEPAARASFNFNGNGNTQVWQINDWSYGVTEGGSSGSLLLDQNDRVIGVLSGGSAACAGTTDNGGFDIYGRMDTSWNSGFSAAQRLRDWLDPTNSGVQQFDGAYYSTLSNPGVVVSKLEIRVYPNPSNGLYQIESPTDVRYEVFNLNGQKIKDSESSLTSNQIDLTGVANGLYFVKITAGDQTVTRKLIKQ